MTTVALLAGGLATAQAQSGPDTELTPKAKPPTQWTIVGGAEYGADGELVDFSQTPFTVDFFTTSFSPSGEVGLFGGWECADPNTDFSALDSCIRMPAIYRLSKNSAGDTSIERIDLRDEGPGFVASIAWLDETHALAVGGTGQYPRREPVCEPDPCTDPADYAAYDRENEHGAGKGRAWLYEDGAWTELTTDMTVTAGGSQVARLPSDMGALTAVDCDPLRDTPQEDGWGACFAGGLQQIWRWDAGVGEGLAGFDPDPVTREEVPPAAGGAEFRYRVRALVVNRSDANAEAGAVTSGCCLDMAPGEVGAKEGALFLATASPLDSPERTTSWAAKQHAIGVEDASSNGAPFSDSYYSIWKPPGPTSLPFESGATAVAVPGGTPAEPEPGSRIVGLPPIEVDGGGPRTDPDPFDRRLDDLRLLAVGGDYSSTERVSDPFLSSLSGQDDPGSDGKFDWAVGGLKATGQGVAYTTVPSFLPEPRPFTCPDALTGLSEGKCDVAPDGVTNYEVATSRRLVGIPTYTLNSLDFTPNQVGWAAGERGALARLSGSGGLGAAEEPQPPRLHPQRPAIFESDEPFQQFRPPITQPGVVPPLATQPVEELPGPTLVPYGTADPSRWWNLPQERIRSIAMSRDGSESWAVGSGVGGQLTLQHFDSVRWRRCAIDGFARTFEPDPACAGLAQLLERKVGDDSKPATVFDIERIPLELDEDPTNDDEFEAIAVGSPAGPAEQGPAALLIYRDGKWEVDPRWPTVRTNDNPGSYGAQVAFRRPGDGWLVAHDTTSTGVATVYRYVAEQSEADWTKGRWVQCPAPECGAGFNLIPAQGRKLQLRVAGDAVFLAGNRSDQLGSKEYPFVASMTGSGPWVMEFDPACPPPSTPSNCTPTADAEGTLFSLSAVALGDRTTPAWALLRSPATVGDGRYTLLRRMPGANSESYEWDIREVEDAAEQFLAAGTANNLGPHPTLTSFRGAAGEERAVLVPAEDSGHALFPPLEYHAERDRWEVLPAPFQSGSKDRGERRPMEPGQAVITATAPDGLGGLWLTAQTRIPTGCGGEICEIHPQPADYFYRYTTQRHRAVFEDAAAPISTPITDLDGTADGTVWVSTESDRIYRYDRLSGWTSIRVPGWDTGRVVTRPSHVYSVAVNDGGTGIAVGEDGRIASIAPTGVQLDPASGVRCSDMPPPTPCGTPRDLVAADVAPDGSALAGGKKLTLMWRSAGGSFHTIDRPNASVDATVTGISMPDPTRAWITLSTGQIFSGTLAGPAWRWVRESEASAAADERRFQNHTYSYPDGRAQLNAVAVDGDGRGLAVGDRGAMLEREPNGRWKRLNTGFLDNLHSIALPPDGYGDGAIVGGGVGLVLTRAHGAFHIVRAADITDPLTTGSDLQFAARIVGVAIAGGSTNGEVEAWAASQVPSAFDPRSPAPGGLLHYASSDDPFLQPNGRAAALPDAPEPGAGELTVAALGRSECQLGHPSFCPEFQGTNLFNEALTRRIQAELEVSADGSTGAFASVFTGDLNGATGTASDEGLVATNAPPDPNVVQDRWRDSVAEPLGSAGVPFFAVPGEHDLSRATACYIQCRDTQEFADAGVPLQWKETFATMPAPWGNAEPYSAAGYTYRPLESSAPADTANATGEGANTHYALDVVNEATDQPVARLVFADTSNARSLTASDPNQNPTEPQAQWLEQVLCSEGSATDTPAVNCTRPPGLPAVVVTTTPTYSYGPGGIDGTQTEGAAFEEILLRNKVTALITGHLGWNGLYYTHAPGLHSPEPGGAHPDSENPPEPPGGAAATGLLPTVVASSAGGRFGVDGSADGEATEGYWHGYSVIRIPQNGDPKDVIVEQRPILDWIGIEGQKHVLRPRQKLVLGGYGREPLGTDTSVRIDRIENEAVTHRFDLLAADPEEPWMPLTDQDAPTQADGPDPYSACGTYICLTEDVGTIDPQSGEVRAGSGRHNGAYGLALLSVGEKAATYPVYFEKSPSFKAAASPTPKLDLKVATPPPPPGVETPPVPSFQSPTFNAPQIPTAPLLAVPVALTSTPASPPAPPVPPPAAPANPGPSPLDLSFAPTGLTVAPTASVIPPPAPPIQPAPPGGARKEARQRQAAAQKSGADGAEAEAQDMGGDQANAPDSPHGAEMTRRDPAPARSEDGFTRQDHSFTRLDRASHGSPAIPIGAGLTLAALALALGFTTLRPDPRRRKPEVPAPAWARRRRGP